MKGKTKDICGKCGLEAEIVFVRSNEETVSYCSYHFYESLKVGDLHIITDGDVVSTPPVIIINEDIDMDIFSERLKTSIANIFLEKSLGDGSLSLSMDLSKEDDIDGDVCPCAFCASERGEFL